MAKKDSPVSDLNQRRPAGPAKNAAYEELLAHVPNAALLHVDGRIRAANAAFHELTGLSPDKKFRALTHYLHTADKKAIQRALRGPNTPEEPQTMRLVRADGTPCLCLMTATPAKPATTGPQGHILSFVDLTETAPNEQIGVADDARALLALQSADQGIWDVNLVTNQAYFSTAWREMRGYGDDEPVSHVLEEWIKKVHPFDRARVATIIERQQNGEIRDIAYEYRERHKLGHYVWILCLGRAVTWNPDGSPTRIMGTNTDITTIKSSEDERFALSNRLEMALEISQVGVWEIDVTTGAVFWDRTIRNTYGVSRTQTITRADWADLLHPEDRDDAIGRLEAAFSKKTNFQADFRTIRPDGETRFIRARASFYRTREGLTKILGVQMDVTEQKLREAELRQAREAEKLRNLELEAARALMEHNANHDALTGLPNRRFLELHLAKLTTEGKRSDKGSDQNIALLHVDLDRFKEINDTLGHAAGDLMLLHAAATLKKNLEPDDFIARIGGDEFVIIISRPITRRGLTAIARKITTQMSTPIQYQSKSCRVGASIGIATEAVAAIDLSALLIRADIALYQAKRQGRGRAAFFTPALQAEVTSNKQLADEILVALEKNQFTVHYQPKYEAAGRQLSGVEALVRWQHPQRGLLAPASFLQIAESLSVVEEIDRIVLETALRQHKKWRDKDILIPQISVNVSARRLRSEKFPDQLRKLSFEPESLSFELLETIFLEEEDDIISWNIDNIREMGIGIDIDDFGSGHASIVSLLKLRPDRFKIDRRLIKPITTSRRQRDLVASIIQIGRSLNVAVVAEGVETATHADILAELGCQYLQGYWFGHPMSAADLETHIGQADLKRA